MLQHHMLMITYRLVAHLEVEQHARLRSFKLLKYLRLRKES